MSKQNSIVLKTQRAAERIRENRAKFSANYRVEILQRLEKSDFMMCTSSYDVVHRYVGFLLPDNLKFTEKGARVINELLRKHFGEFTQEWLDAEAAHLSRVAEDEALAEEKRGPEEEANAEFYAAAVSRISGLFREGNAITKNYGKLLLLLRNEAPPRFKGSRGARIIHSAMLFQIKWAHNWKELGYFKESEDFFANVEASYVES